MRNYGCHATRQRSKLVSVICSSAMRMIRISSTTLAVMLALTAASLSQVAPAPLTRSQGAEIPSLAPLVKKVAPSVVNIAVKGKFAQEQNPYRNDPFFKKFFGNGGREQSAAGSGVIIDAREGYIVTNNHVVGQADEISVALADGRVLQAKLVGTDSATDVAIIKVPAENSGGDIVGGFRQA